MNVDKQQALRASEWNEWSALGLKTKLDEGQLGCAWDVAQERHVPGAADDSQTPFALLQFEPGLFLEPKPRCCFLNLQTGAASPEVQPADLKLFDPVPQLQLECCQHCA